MSLKRLFVPRTVPKNFWVRNSTLTVTILDLHGSLSKIEGELFLLQKSGRRFSTPLLRTPSICPQQNNKMQKAQSDTAPGSVVYLYNHHKEVEKRFSASFFVPFFLTYLRKTGTDSSDFREKFAQKSGKTGTTSSLKRQCFYDKLLSQQGQHPRRGEAQNCKPYLEN